jgi:hypothetical protein
MPEWSGKPFGEFFAALMQALAIAGVRYCILRNYEGFPAGIIGSDIDFLIAPSDLKLAIKAIRSIEGVRVVGYVERPSVALVFLEGISPAPGVRGLELDFDLSLAWKGLPFLSTDAVLQAAIPRHQGGSTFLVPSPVHEAIISLFASLLVGGWLKEKYFPEVERTFAADRSAVIAALLPGFGPKAATRLVDSVIVADRRKVLGCVRLLRVSLVLRSLLRRPVRNCIAFVRHYTSEFVVRFSSRTLETVCVLGPDGTDRATIVEKLMPMLRFSGKIEKRSLRPRLLPSGEPRGLASSSTPDAEVQPGGLASMAMIVRWLVGAWLDRFSERKNLTLRIWESCYLELLVVPQQYGYGGPELFAQLVCKLLPATDLWILLDPATKGVQSGGEDTPSAETLRQLEAYRAFVKTKKRYLILDALQPTDRITESAYTAIIETLAQRAGRELRHCF